MQEFLLTQIILPAIGSVKLLLSFKNFFLPFCKDSSGRLSYRYLTTDGTVSMPTLMGSCCK